MKKTKLTLEERVNKMEQSLKRWQRAAMCLGLALATLCTMAAVGDDDVQDLVMAKRILVMNDKGKVAAQIMGYDFGGSLTVYGEEEKETFSLTPGSLTLKSDETGKSIFTVESDGNQGDNFGGGLLGLSDNEGNPIIQIGQSKKHGYIQIQDKDGTNTMYGPAYR